MNDILFDTPYVLFQTAPLAFGQAGAVAGVSFTMLDYLSPASGWEYTPPDPEEGGGSVGSAREVHYVF
jgi:hypothetical protein